MAIVSEFTQSMQSMLPQWMKMAKDPNSVGAKFLDVFGMEFEDVKQYLDFVSNNQYIDTADIGQIDITYKVPIALPIVLDIETIDTVSALKGEERHFFRVVSTLREFYLGNEEHKAILDREAGVIYIRPSEMLMAEGPLMKPVDVVEINGTPHYEYMLHHIWNAFDEFGLLLGVERLFGERNTEFKERILDVFKKPGNSTKTGLTNAISRELGIEPEQVTLNEFANKAFRGSLLNEEDGSPTKKFLRYVDNINKIFGFTWDNMTWGDAYWRSIEEDQMGLEYLPHVWDASTEGWKDTDFQSGVGDGEELKVIAPKEESNVRNFKYSIGLRGRNSGLERIDPELGFKYKITAKGKILDEEYKPEVYKYTIVSAEIVMLHYLVKGMKDYITQIKVDFNPSTPGYAYDDMANPSMEIVKGTTNLSKSDGEWKYHKLIFDLETNSNRLTPSLNSVTVKWRDINGVLKDFKLDTEADFTRNDVYVNTEMTDVAINPTGAVELGYGEFYHMIDTEGSFMGGAPMATVEIMREGSIRLKLPKE